MRAINTNEDESDYYKLLSEYKDVFAWNYTAMSGLSLKITVHRLAIKDSVKPKKQSQFRFRPELVPEIEKEVNKLIDANFIQEVKFPTWIANIVIVRKKKGQLRVCLDFRNLNDACPNNDFPLMIYQWANVTRWEMRTKPFVRTLEFLWQEGHTAHASDREAEQEFTDVNGERQHVWQTSWAISTRFIGGIIMTHGDDAGLMLPPNLAPIKGVPLRLEIGPRGVANGSVAISRRDFPGKEGKEFGISMEASFLVAYVKEKLSAVQSALLERAISFRDRNIVDVSSYDELKEAISQGKWARGPWSASDKDETMVKEETGATIRCFPFDQPEGSKTCIMTGNPADEVAIFAKSY